MSGSTLDRGASLCPGVRSIRHRQTGMLGASCLAAQDRRPTTSVAPGGGAPPHPPPQSAPQRALRRTTCCGRSRKFHCQVRVNRNDFPTRRQK
eukprot:gene6900-biopygen13497